LAIMQKHKIKVDGHGEVPEPIETFEKMQKAYGWSEAFMRRLKENECIKPTPVQIQAIPALFAKKSSVVLAETGSGKSLAFIAPLLHMIKHGDGLKAVVLSPTRELTIQLYKEFLIFSGACGSSAIKTPRVKFLRKALFPTTQG
jgi:superfamily II DNA/RNA helicase